MAVKVHIAGPNWVTIDASPLVGKRIGMGCSRDWDYCRAIGFTDGRGYCPPRMEGSLEKGACDLAATGGGIVWTWNGREIKPSIAGIPDDHEARIDPLGGWMLQVKPGIGGTARACSRLASGCWTDTERMDCGAVILP